MSDPNGPAESLEARMARIEASLERLHARLDALPSPAPAAAPAPTQAPAPAPAPAPPAPDPGPPHDARPLPGWAPAPGPPQAGAHDPTSPPALARDAALPPSGPMQGPAAVVLTKTPAPPAGNVVPSAPAASVPRTDVSAEAWITRIGLGLLLLGVAFLFKYSVDQGWLTPWVRILIGVGISGAMLGIGWRSRAERVLYSRLLQGGGIAGLHLCVFAAHLLLGLVGPGVALAGTAAVNVLAVTLGWIGGSATLTGMGLAGAYAAPFALPNVYGQPAVLAGYLWIVTAAAAPMMWVRRSRVLLLITLLGSGLGLTTLLLLAQPGTTLPWGDRAAIQAVIVVAWAVCGLMPGWLVRSEAWDRASVTVRSDAMWTPLVVGIISWVLTAHTWQVDESPAAGWIAFAMAAVLAACARPAAPRTIGIHEGFALGAWALLWLGWSALTSTAALLAGSSVILAAMFVQARHHGSESIASLAHLMGLGVLVGLVGRVLWGLEDGSRALASLGWDALTLGALAVAAIQQRNPLAQAWYGLPAHLGLLALTALHAGRLESGTAVTSVLWALIGTVALVVGLRRQVRMARALGLTTFALLVGKLLLIDLGNMPAVVRVLLFMGLGGGLVGLGYALPKLERWGRPHEPESEP